MKKKDIDDLSIFKDYIAKVEQDSKCIINVLGLEDNSTEIVWFKIKNATLEDHRQIALSYINLAAKNSLVEVLFSK